jgi:pyridoxamine 5'-phosphate oxidase
LDPLPLVQHWLDEAGALPRRNPFALALATTDAKGRPAVRYVLLKSLSVDRGFIVFFTNYGSRKARELNARGFAAAALYWEDLGRQLRFEGPILRSPAAESDAYFATRPRGSQLNAWASEQSQPLAHSAHMESKLRARQQEFAAQETVPRPPFWGGYRLWLSAVEIWCEGADRFHERARYERELTKAADDGFSAGGWRHQYLQP